MPRARRPPAAIRLEVRRLPGGLSAFLRATPRRWARSGLHVTPGDLLACFAGAAMTISIGTGRSILLVDGLGAAVTAVIVGLILPLFQPWIGLPTPSLRLLGGFAIVLAAYSLSRHVKGHATPTALRRVASANLAYCALTAGIVTWHARDVTAWGFAYFGAEIVIIAALSWRELALSRAIAIDRT